MSVWFFQNQIFYPASCSLCYATWIKNELLEFNLHDVQSELTLRLASGQQYYQKPLVLREFIR